MPFFLQAGIISPSKLRMKLLGPHHHRKKDGSNSNSSRTSPSRIEDAEFVNSLLDSKNDNLDDEGLQLQFINFCMYICYCVSQYLSQLLCIYFSIE